MKLLKKLIYFIKKGKTHPLVKGTEKLLEVDEVLNNERIARAFLYYRKHKEYVHRIMQETGRAFEPSQPEDLADPSIWKPGYWRWFLAEYEIHNKKLSDNY